MTTNFLLENPVKVVVYDPIQNINKRSYIFLGDVPKYVAAAVSQPDSTNHAKTLKEYYGPGYKTKLGLDLDPNQAWIRSVEPVGVIGGEDYREIGTFIHSGIRYDLDCALLAVADQPIIRVRVADLAWILDQIPKEYFSDPYENLRVEQSDISAPILITSDNIVIDGVHRLRKAVLDGLIELPARKISSANLRKCIISKSGPIRHGAGDFDETEIEELLKSAQQSGQKPRLTDVSSADLHAEFTPGFEFVQDIHIFPEDKLSEVKEKIYLATNIPTYRQHVFYIRRDRLWTLYKIHADGIYNIDIRLLPKFHDNIHGIPIDKSLYDSRHNIRVEAQDMFTIMADVDAADNVLYVVDLAQFTARLYSQLAELVSDTYQFELFYFGFIIKFWPQLTQECLTDYLVAETELQYKFPDLAKNKNVLRSVYRAESEIINSNYKNISRATSFAEGTVTISIVQLIALVNTSRTLLNIRNLFDMLRVSRCIPEIHGYIEYNNRKYVLRKRHTRNGSDIPFPSGGLMRNGVTIAISLRKSDQESFHTRTASSTAENEQSRYMFLNIWADGRYHIRSLWNEDEEYGFDSILKIMKKFINPLISGINNLGKYVFIEGAALPLISGQNIVYQSLNICIFWKKVVLESTFKFLKTLWDPYMRARITGPRNVQQFDKYEFSFRKGMHDFDTSAIERILSASNNINLANYYAYLSNNSIKQKWDQNYDGRVVKLSHRTTDVKFEVLDIRAGEFEIFHRYIISFIYQTAHNEKFKTPSTKARGDVKKLRKLREEDPKLYNLKQYGSKQLYSVLCQNHRQPLIYTTDEIKDMPAADVKKLTKYWNFTLGKPAYYGCPNKNYPHLSYIVGVHPRHYCLPCCNKKTQTDDDSKKARVNTICARDHRFTETENKESSRHVMNYGKNIDLARLSKTPPGFKNLLYNTLPSGSYYLFGCSQHLPGVENIGILYSLAEALGTTIEDLAQKTMTGLTIDLFGKILQGGLINYFRDLKDLIATMRDIFIEQKIFSLEIQKFKQWPELFVELSYILFRVSVFTFIDETGAGENIDLFVPDFVRDEILYINSTKLADTLGAGQKYVVVVKKQNQVYPIFVIDTDKYFKTFEIEQKIYRRNDKIISILFSMIGREIKTHGRSSRLDLAFAEAFAAANKYTIIRKHINKQNLCYAVIIGAASKQMYMPIDYSPYHADGVEVTFEAFRPKNIQLADVKLLIEEINKFGFKLEPQKYAKFGAKFCGLICSGFRFYFTSYSAAEIDPTLPVEIQRYDLTEVNTLILDRTPPSPDPRSQRLGAALYQNCLYHLFVIEFANYLNRERNAIMRETLRNLIQSTNFKKDVAPFRKTIKSVLQDYPADHTTIQNQLVGFYFTHFDKNSLLEQMENTVYDFDRVTLNRLRKLPRADMKNELKIIADQFSVRKDLDMAGMTFPNIYVSCSDMKDNPGYCDGKKLIINKPLDDLIDILAADLTDDLKAKYMFNSIWMDIQTEYLAFTKHPNEIVTIYKLTE